MVSQDKRVGERVKDGLSFINKESRLQTGTLQADYGSREDTLSLG